MPRSKQAKAATTATTTATKLSKLKATKLHLRPHFDQLCLNMEHQMEEFGSWLLKYVCYTPDFVALLRQTDGCDARSSCPKASTASTVHDLALWVNYQRQLEFVPEQVQHLEHLFSKCESYTARQHDENWTHPNNGIPPPSTYGRSGSYKQQKGWDRQWMLMFAKLNFFQAIHGHLDIPIRWYVNVCLVLYDFLYWVL